ncbi:MAG: hypothetical protein JW878_10710 [Methanomicrobia archaeon]|nr:hypothetical protein [Methanomicrobia archaeon]
MIEGIESFGRMMEDPHKGWPTFGDIQEGRVFTDENIVNDVENKLQEYRYCLIRGAEGRGKTVLARIVGDNKDREGWNVIFIDVRGVRREHITGICDFYIKPEGKKSLFIIENAHFSPDEITPKLMESANKQDKSSFIFTSRKIFPRNERRLISNPFEEWEENGWYVDLKSGLDMARGMIHIKNPAYSLTKEDESWLEREFGEQNLNLRRLNWYLDTWGKMGGPLSAIPKEKVLEEILNYFIEELKDGDLEEMLLKVAGIFQFDVDFYGRDYDRTYLTELVKRVLITF